MRLNMLSQARAVAMDCRSVCIYAGVGQSSIQNIAEQPMRDMNESDNEDIEEGEGVWGMGRSHSGGHDSRMRRILELNVAIYHDILGMDVSADSFRLDTGPEELQAEEESESEHDYDYGDWADQHPGVHYGLEDRLEEEDSDHSHLFWGMDHNQEFDHSSLDSGDVPFFGREEQVGMEAHQIEALPTMQWGKTHDLFNRGEKCPICLQEFQLGHSLRVMNCLHRFHLGCLDQWLAVKGNCPSCRNAPA